MNANQIIDQKATAQSGGNHLPPAREDISMHLTPLARKGLNLSQGGVVQDPLWREGIRLTSNSSVPTQGLERVLQREKRVRSRTGRNPNPGCLLETFASRVGESIKYRGR